MRITKRKTCRDAVELMDELTGVDSLFGKSQPYSWLFRGVTKRDHRLIPSAWRKGAFEKYGLISSNDTQGECEWEILKAFYETANLRGMPLPVVSQQMHEMLQSTKSETIDREVFRDPSWPPSDFLPIFGLAQHYGLPTRLLDWTYDPRIAAYFAASGVMRHVQNVAPGMKDLVIEYVARTGKTHDDNLRELEGDLRSKTMVVWALNKIFDDSLRDFEPHMLCEPLPYEIVSVPYSSNPNIQAQQGTFTVLRHSEDIELDYRKPFDKVLKDHFLLQHRDKPKRSPTRLFFKFELPWHEYGKLLRLLANTGVNASTVYPGFHGVVGAVSEKLRWWGHRHSNARIRIF